MSTIIENDLKELKDLINLKFQQMDSRFDHMEAKIDKLEANYISLDKTVTKIEAKIDTMKPVFDKIPELSEKIGEYKNWKQISIILLTGFLTSVFWAFRNTPNF
ncbi:hypothetical protein VKI21_01300 [Cyanobacterium aponinum UTEX 3222]|uniref:Uncharacterized protein n=2 Tax=Cyanobacterium aponinum TaxID=379064 RepID=K9Z0H7_CYAAP|nr:hypothetical protein [Cyanobacterium aponinum]WRL42348.1 hypothetical protein VKI21_01300 [Cyanobacterium aponinum UTEX 3222]AFZ52217.1 hypothetical protein Cyan10605_0056 [Cyanobacterium aponinum PCC 10605]MBD2393023.1 hypothetical protein [Cyanobacterium aponinum FACHB-4101]MTF38137.1 hypothetical protein [Cyanobacterium aponinum 0216]WRL39571.1 hypothetical protein VKI22_05655 [Cyanobacterium aponinum UTEX 3221]